MASASRTEEACLRASFKRVARPVPFPETLERFIAEARAKMGEARWAELNAEWESNR